MTADYGSALNCKNEFTRPTSKSFTKVRQSGTIKLAAAPRW